MLIYNTLTRTKEEFSAPHNKRVNLFVCGPTVYDSSHIGHARTYIVFDAIAKYLRSQGVDLFYLQNITDIDDKIIHRAKELGIDPLKLSAEETKKYYADMKAIKVDSVSKYAKASDYIEEIQKQIKTLIEKGNAYESRGSVYFDISTFPNFGKLSGQNLQALQKAERTEEDRNKKHPHDFVLWRGRKKDSGEPVWDSPWGWGRPGWHIEDTAITEKEFEPQYDLLHGGGAELIFPHHEAEIAQVESASGKHLFVKYWLHSGWVTVKGEKMSKSLGNFITIRDILKKHSPEALRLWALQTHYRSPIEYSENAIQAAENAIKKISEIRARLHLVQEKQGPKNLPYFNESAFKKYYESYMNDDLNTGGALGIFFNHLGTFEGMLNINEIKSNDARLILKYFFQNIEKIFGIIPSEVPVPKSVGVKVQKREVMRAEKRWEEADSMRQEIADEGFDVKDTPDGPIILPIRQNKPTL